MIRFFVPGVARPAGSKRAFQHRYTGRMIVTDSSGAEGKHWRSSVAQAASQAFDGELLGGPLCLSCVFVFVRPAGHYGTGKNAKRVKASAPSHPAGPPDTTKLLRALEDSLTRVIWRDDAQIVTQLAHKIYGVRPGVHVAIWQAVEPIEEPERD